MGKHLTSEQRYTIWSMLNSGYSQIKIAEAIGRCKTVISREISRNRDQRSKKYKWELAERKASDRRLNKNKAIKFTDTIKGLINTLLHQYYSPEQIAGWLKLKGIETVSHECIYQYIWRNKKNGGQLHTFLRHKGRKYRKRGAQKDSRGIIKNRKGIEKRPNIVDEKSRIGDLEIDTVIGKNHKGALLTINDRRTGLLRIRLLKGKNAKELARATIEALYPLKKHIHTITADNGKEFAEHQIIAAELNVDVFFARPYHSWERGANENANGLIRQFFPKGSSFENLTPERVDEVEKILNNRPRKRLNYSNPQEKWDQYILNQSVAFIA